jgi:hypothetical protein
MWEEWDADMMMMRPSGACAACGGGADLFWAGVRDLRDHLCCGECVAVWRVLVPHTGRPTNA